jgi:hypothetical protein
LFGGSHLSGDPPREISAETSAEIITQSKDQIAHKLNIAVRWPGSIEKFCERVSLSIWQA